MTTRVAAQKRESLFIPLKYFIKREEGLAFIHHANNNNKSYLSDDCWLVHVGVNVFFDEGRRD